jgi:molybdopterin converting factor small subunit
MAAETRVDELEGELGQIQGKIDELEDNLEELDSFAKVTLRDRRISENSDLIDALSDSFSGFAENTSEKLGELENRVEVNTMVLAVIIEAFEEMDADLDFSDVEGYQEDHLVTTDSADNRLAEAIEGSS